MSKTLNELYEEIKNDENLQKDLAGALESKNKETISKFITDNGCDASLDEAKLFLENKTEELKQSGELSPEQLEAVSGGATPVITFITIWVTAAGGAGIATAVC